MSEPKVLMRHTDRFSLFKNARNLGANGRRYVLSAVKSMLESSRTQEDLRLGESYGYYGHQRRVLTKKLDLPEVSVIMLEGKPVVLENVPSNRTVSITVDDEGVVTHTQEIFDNEQGRIIAGLINSGAGGWSWATGGKDTPMASIPTAFHGVDYVLNPNYVSLDHPASMFESNESREESMLESMKGQNFSDEAAQAIITHYGKMASEEMILESLQRNEQLETSMLEARGQILELESQIAEQQQMLESLQNVQQTLTDTRNARGVMFGEILDKLPVYVTEAQRHAFINMDKPEHVAAAKSLLDSLARQDIRTLPLPAHKPAVKPKQANSQMLESRTISFEDKVPKFS